jgi:hypothetical protein
MIQPDKQHNEHWPLEDKCVQNHVKNKGKDCMVYLTTSNHITTLTKADHTNVTALSYKLSIGGGVHFAWPMHVSCSGKTSRLNPSRLLQRLLKDAGARVGMIEFSQYDTHIIVAAKPHERTVQLSAVGGKLASAAWNK